MPFGTRSPRSTRVALAASALVVATGIAACGSRTELDVPPGDSRDAGMRGFDAGIDALSDVSFGSDANDASFVDAIVPFDVNVGPDSGLDCPGGLPVAYLLDDSGALYTFNPSTLDVQPLGGPDCGTQATNAGPWTLSVSRESVAYVIYEDWNIYAVDLKTLACKATPFQPGQLGINDDFAIAVSRTAGVEHLFLFGQTNGTGDPILASMDLTSFVLAEVGPALPALPAAMFGYDMQADLLGHLFVYSDNGQLTELDGASASVLGTDATGFPSASIDGTSWAVMSYNNQVYLFANQQVARYDIGSHTTEVLGTLNTASTIVGASALPCFGSL